ncbi:MAG: molybdopterin-synthase adenylyltransferase MoeB [Planctomycetota bacterium]
MRTVQDVLADLRRQYKEIDPGGVQATLGKPGAPVLIDVREPDETEQGIIEGAIVLPRGRLEMSIEKLVPDRRTPIIAYCAGGNRSLFAVEGLARLGYDSLQSMAGGFSRWKNEGRPIHTPRVLSAAEKRRYSRHLLIPEVGERGQQKLLDSRVLMIGAGGLGSPAAYYLAAAGVGTIGIVDYDVVDESNLQRQILHRFDRIGQKKVDSARETLLGINPGITVRGHDTRIDSSNVDELLANYDLIVDGSDNFATRYLINDASVKHRIPVVHGSVYRFEGQVTVFKPFAGPCYRCLYPEPPPPELAPSCAEAGVLGILPGVVGLLEAVEAIKLIIGAGDPLIGRLLHYDALSTEFCELKLARDPKCAYCSNPDHFPGYVDYVHFCANPAK